MDITSRINAFWLLAAQRLLYGRDLGWADVACALEVRPATLSATLSAEPQWAGSE